MRALLCALAIMAGTAPAWAQDCPSEQDVRGAMKTYDEQAGGHSTVIPMLTHSGRRYLVAKLPGGGGLIIAPDDKGCFEQMTAVPEPVLDAILRHTEGT